MPKHWHSSFRRNLRAISGEYSGDSDIDMHEMHLKQAVKLYPSMPTWGRVFAADVSVVRWPADQHNLQWWTPARRFAGWRTVPPCTVTTCYNDQWQTKQWCSCRSVKPLINPHAKTIGTELEHIKVCFCRLFVTCHSVQHKQPTNLFATY